MTTLRRNAEAVDGLRVSAAPRSHMNPVKSDGQTVTIAWLVQNTGGAPASARVDFVNVSFGLFNFLGTYIPVPPGETVTVTMTTRALRPDVNCFPGANTCEARLRRESDGSFIAPHHRFTLTMV